MLETLDTWVSQARLLRLALEAPLLRRHQGGPLLCEILQQLSQERLFAELGVETQTVPEPPEELFHAAWVALQERVEGEENFSIAMEFAQYHSTFHSFLECDPRGVEELFRGLGHRLGLNAQLSKQALLGELLQDFTEEWAALMAAEERRLQREAQQAGLRHPCV